jgi:hypothetical protein
MDEDVLAQLLRKTHLDLMLQVDHQNVALPIGRYSGAGPSWQSSEIKASEELYSPEGASYHSPGQRPISVNLSEAVSAPLSGRFCQPLGDGSPLPQNGGQTLRQEKRCAYLTVHEFNLTPPATSGLPRHSPRGKTIRRYAPSVRSRVP